MPVTTRYTRPSTNRCPFFRRRFLRACNHVRGQRSYAIVRGNVWPYLFRCKHVYTATRGRHRGLSRNVTRARVRKRRSFLAETTESSTRRAGGIGGSHRPGRTVAKNLATVDVTADSDARTVRRRGRRPVTPPPPIGLVTTRESVWTWTVVKGRGDIQLDIYFCESYRVKSFCKKEILFSFNPTRQPAKVFDVTTTDR